MQEIKKKTQNIEKDHNVIWVKPEEYIDKMFREWQRYIMKKFIEKKGVIRNENNTSITIAKKKGTNGFIKSQI